MDRGLLLQHIQKARNLIPDSSAYLTIEDVKSADEAQIELLSAQACVGDGAPRATVTHPDDCGLGFTQKQWGKIYNFLVEHLEAPEDLRFSFLQHYAEPETPMEYRVCPALGFGGKLRYNRQQRHLDVYMYPEDETPARLELKALANSTLAEMVKSFVAENRAEADKSSFA